MFRLLTIMVCLMTMTSAEVIDYSWPLEAPKSSQYRVRIIQDGTVQTMTTLQSEPYQIAGPDGTGVAGFLAGRTLSYLPFAFSGVIEVEVTKLYGTAAPRVEISPKSYNIEPHFFDGRIVRFFLTNEADRPEYISVNFVTADNLDANGSGDDIKHGLMLFGDAPETDIPSQSTSGTVVYSPSLTAGQIANADLIYFPPGYHNLTLRYPTNPFRSIMPIGKNGQQVYVAGGAFIRGAIHGKGKDNVKIYGRGVFAGHNLVWHDVRDENGEKEAFMHFAGSDDCIFEGFTIDNPTHHTLPCSKRNTYRQFKIIGWTWNADGVRPGDGSLFEEIFIKTMDDYDYARDQHIGRNSVIWPMQNGAFGQLGWNNLGDGNTTYRNIRFINAEWASYNRNRGIIGSVLNQGVNQANNLIENLTVENNTILLANITIERDPSEPFDSSNPGLIRDFTFRNIIFEKAFRAPNGNLVKNPISGFTHNGATAMVKDIRFINLVLGNTLVTQENHAQFFDIDPATTSNITFTTEGLIHTVDATSSTGGTLSPSGSLPTPAGMTRSIAAIPNSGKRIKRVLIDGVDVGRMQNINFEDISSNHSVHVEFEDGDDYFTLPAIPSVPTNLTATALSSDSIALNWLDTSPNETSFEIQRSPSGTDNWTLVTTKAANTESHTDSGLTSGASFTYRIRAVSSEGDSSWSETATAIPSSTIPAYDESAILLLGNTSNDVITSTESTVHYAVGSDGSFSNTGVTLTSDNGIPWRFHEGQDLGSTPAGPFSLYFNSYQEVDETTGEGLTPSGGYGSTTSNAVGIGISNGANGNFVGNESGAGGAEGIVFGLDATGLPPQLTLRLKSVTLNQTGSNFFTGQDSARIISRSLGSLTLESPLGSPTDPVNTVTIDAKSLNITLGGGNSTTELFTILNGKDGSQVGFRIQSLELEFGLPAAAPAGSYTAWSDLNAPGEDPGEDHDGDGMPNGIEHLMGETGSSFTPNPGIQNNTITWPKDPLALTTWQVLFSENLRESGYPGGWAPAPPEMVTDNGDSITVEVPDDASRLFIRLSTTAQ